MPHARSRSTDRALPSIRRCVRADAGEHEAIVIELDASFGEGGGQILRSALVLSVIKG